MLPESRMMPTFSRLVRGQIVCPERLRHAQHTIQRGADFVAHRGKKIGLRGGRGFRGFVCLVENELLLLFLVNVQHEADGAKRLPVLLPLHFDKQPDPANTVEGQ